MQKPQDRSAFPTAGQGRLGSFVLRRTLHSRADRQRGPGPRSGHSRDRLRAHRPKTWTVDRSARAAASARLWSMRAIVPLDDEPRFRPFPFAPPLDGPVRRAVDDAALVLSRTKGRFDGPIAFCHGVSRDGAIVRRRGRYAEAMVVFAEPTQAYRLGFALGVQLFVERAEGVTLFQQRGPSIGRDPLLWTASASGGLGHAERPRDAVLADAAEEIGLGEEDLPGFRPLRWS